MDMITYLLVFPDPEGVIISKVPFMRGGGGGGVGAIGGGGGGGGATAELWTSGAGGGC